MVYTYTFDWATVFNQQTLSALLMGARYTFLISILSLIFGSILGFVVAMGRMHSPRPIAIIIIAYIDFFRTTPVLVQMIWIYYVVPILIHTELGPVTAGVIALTLNSGAFLGEVFRGGLQSINKGQHDAAQMLGLSRFQKMRYIIVPQAMRSVLPATTNSFILLIKDSSLLSVIAVGEMTYQISNEVAVSYRPLELYTILAVAYFVVTYPVSLLANRLEKRMRVPGLA